MEAEKNIVSYINFYGIMSNKKRPDCSSFNHKKRKGIELNQVVMHTSKTEYMAIQKDSEEVFPSNFIVLPSEVQRVTFDIAPPRNKKMAMKISGVEVLFTVINKIDSYSSNIKSSFYYIKMDSKKVINCPRV